MKKVLFAVLVVVLLISGCSGCKKVPMDKLVMYMPGEMANDMVYAWYENDLPDGLTPGMHLLGLAQTSTGEWQRAEGALVERLALSSEYHFLLQWPEELPANGMPEKLIAVNACYQSPELDPFFPYIGAWSGFLRIFWYGEPKPDLIAGDEVTIRFDNGAETAEAVCVVEILDDTTNTPYCLVSLVEGEPFDGYHQNYRLFLN
ncbi:MAG: hypothetical protein WCT37_00805 [Patescibacteria group bacterium]|jgi:hypothetical protein